MITPQDIQLWLQQAMSDAEVRVSGDGHHFEAVIVSAAFAGKSLLQRQRMVYGALGDKMQVIHALSMQTLTPDEVDIN